MYRLKSNRNSVDGPAQLFTLEQDGGFEIAKLIAGWYSFVHRVRVEDNGTTAIAIYGPFELKGGELRELTLGDDGRSVVGRFMLPENDAPSSRPMSVSVSSGKQPSYPAAPNDLDSESTLAWWNAYWKSDEGRRFREYNRRSFRTSIGRDGSFYFPSLPPGKYTLRLHELKPVSTSSTLEQTEFEIPVEGQWVPIDLGNLSVSVRPLDQQALNPK
jgi:hypothetical protein